MTCPRREKYVIDLFCGEGGASRGYYEAGFNVVGVDSDPERTKRYPYPVFTGEWAEGLLYWLLKLPGEVAFVHASPPCQPDSDASHMARARGIAVDYPRLIPPVREILVALREATDIDYVIENVPQAALIDPVYLCGSMFSLTADWRGEKVGLERKRGFEASFDIIPPVDCACDLLRSVPVYGHGAPGYRKDQSPEKKFAGPGFAQLTRDVMTIDWMSRRGLTESIPPAYATHVGYSWQAVTADWQHHDTHSLTENVTDSQNAHYEK